MTTELRVRNQSQQIYVRALSAAYRNGVQLHDPSVWLLRDTETEEKMLRDAAIAGAVGYRRHLIAGKRWDLTPRNESSPRSPLAVAVGTELLKGIKHFTQARLNLARAFFSGSRFARIHGQPRTLTIGDGQPRTWWVPTRIEDLDKRFYRIVPEIKGEELSAHWERWDIVKMEFVKEDSVDAVQTIRHVYQDDQATLGYGRSLREALGWSWYARTNVFMETLQAVERFSQGIITAKIDGLRDSDTGLPNEEAVRAWVDLLEDLRSRHVLVFDKADEIETLSLNGEGWQLLHELRAELRSEILTLILGANLTTSADKGGSYALAEVQENSTEALIQFDRETLEETLTDDLIGCVWFKNHANLVELGIHEEKPHFSIPQEKKQDPQERATVAQTLNAMGVPLSMEDVLEQTGFRKPDEGEEVIEGNVPQPAGMPGFGGGFGGFDLGAPPTDAPPAGPPSLPALSPQ